VSVACFKALFHICLEEAISHNRRSVSLLTEPELLEYSLGTQTTRYGRSVCSWLLTGNVEGTVRKLHWSIETYLRYGSIGTNAFLLATRPGVENLWQQCRIWHLYIYTSLLRSVGQSVLVSGSHLEPMAKFFFLFDNFRFLAVRRPL
jgi:hypothetical protein